MKSLAIVAAAILACAAAPQTPAGDVNAARALIEFGRVCEAEGKLLWGKSLCGPLVLVNPQTRAAIANQPDPDGAFRKEGNVYIGRFPERFTPSNTSIHWADKDWATVMLPLPLDPYGRLSLLAHESFHRLQPALGLRAPDTPDACLDTEKGRLWFRVELRALAQGLRGEGPAARRAAGDARLFRAERYRLCAGSASIDAAMEKQEGLAEYTGVFVALRTTGDKIERAARVVEGWEDADAFARSFAYATGPALGLLLDRYANGWRSGVVMSSLDSLMETALHFRPPADLELRAGKRAAIYGYAAVASAEREREERHQALLAELTARFLDGPVIEFPEAPEMNRNFDPNTLVPFPPHGTFYPTGVFSATWGKLSVEGGGGALVLPDNRSLRVAAPEKAGGRPLRGQGWVLERPYNDGVVRPERRVLLADERSVRVSAGAPGSRPQARAEMPSARAGRQKPLKETGARERAATSSERRSHVILSAERCSKGPSRSYHGEGNRQQSGPERLLDLSGVWGGGTFPEKSVEQERPYLAAWSGRPLV